MQKYFQSILFHYISFLQWSRDRFVILQGPPSQDPGLPSKGRGTLAEWLCCRVRAGPEISKQSTAVTQTSESFQSQNHLRTITFRFGADVYNRALRRTQTHSLGCFAFETRAQSTAGLKIWNCLIPVDLGILVDKRRECDCAEIRKLDHCSK